MATSNNPPNKRPGLPGQRSSNEDERPRQSSIEGQLSPFILTYVGFNIEPRETQHDESKGRWYRATTTIMPATQRDLEHLVRKQSSSNCNAMEIFYSPQMKGSKRRHITHVIEVEDDAHPNRKHELAYLMLEHDHKHRDSKRSKIRTLSIQIILECQKRPPPHTNLSLPAPTPAHGMVTNRGGIPSRIDGSERPITGATPNSLMATPRPQYVPPYAQYRGPQSYGSLPSGQATDVRNGRNSSLQSRKLSSNISDSDESQEDRSASPASTVSSGVASSASRRHSSSSYPSNLSSASVSRTYPGNADESGVGGRLEGNVQDFRFPQSNTGQVSPQIPRQAATGTHEDQSYRTVDSKCSQDRSIPTHTRHDTLQADPAISRQIYPSYQAMAPVGPIPAASTLPRFYTSTGTQTDRESVSNHEEPPAINSGITPTVTPDRGNESDSEDEVTSIEESADGLEPSNHFPNQADLKPISYDKPAWMDNMQPVVTPITAKEKTNPFDSHFDNKMSAVTHYTDADKIEASPSLECLRESDPSAAGVDKDIAQSRGPSPKPNEPEKSLSRMPVRGVDRAKDDKPSRQDITMSEYFTRLSRPPPPPPPPLVPQYDAQTSSRRTSEDVSSKQRKRVTFSLDTPVSTVPSTPIHETPPSSPDSVSSANSSDSRLALPAPMALTSTGPRSLVPHRPSMQRSSTVSSGYGCPMPNSQSLPSRSESYQVPPPKTLSARAGGTYSSKEPYTRLVDPDPRSQESRFERRRSDDSNEGSKFDRRYPPRR